MPINDIVARIRRLQTDAARVAEAIDLRAFSGGHYHFPAMNVTAEPKDAAIAAIAQRAHLACADFVRAVDHILGTAHATK